MLIPLITALAMAAPLGPAASTDQGCAKSPIVVVRVEDDGPQQIDIGADLNIMLKQLAGGDGACCSKPQVAVQTITLHASDGDDDESRILYISSDDEDGEEAGIQVKTFIMSPDDDSTQQSQTMYYAFGGPTLCCAAAGDEDKSIFVTACASANETKTYLGVRISPIPAPLAAHVGDSGVMIVNVVEDSPAEQAGLERYDIIIKFDGQTIDSPEDLTTAVAAAEAGDTAKITVLRGGRQQKLDITPASQPITIDLHMLYDEPAETLLKDYVNMRGLTLRPGPNGNWVMEDLGDLHDLSGMLDKLNTLDIDLRLDDQLLDKLGKDLDVRIQPGNSSSYFYSSDAQITVQVNEDGNVTTIKSDSDGKIHVTKVDADGNESEATYDNPEEFEKADPDSFRYYSQTNVSCGPRAFWVQPGAARARKLRSEYQIDVQTKIKEALEQARESQQQAKEALKQARESQEHVKRQYQKVHTSAEPDKLMVFSNADGSLKVVVTKDGGKISYEFNSRAAFKAAEPELYEQVKDDLN